MSSGYDSWASRRRSVVSAAQIAESNRYFARLLKKAEK